jgi:AraC family transcriptional regulator
MHVRTIEPRAIGWRGFAWPGGVLDSAHRPFTDVVEGTICIPHPLVLVTVRGGARLQEVTTACGHRYHGRDLAGAVSFVPAGCERRLRMQGVRSEWASLLLMPEHLSAPDSRDLDIPPLTNIEDGFVAGLLGEMVRLLARDGRLEPAYGEIMALALWRYLLSRYGNGPLSRVRVADSLPAWRIRRIADFVDANLDRPILVRELASLVGLSAGHLSRAFRTSLGTTLLDYINEKRVRRAMAILSGEDVPMAELALRVGFVSPSHFTRTFRRFAGCNPSGLRRPRRGVP